MNISDIAKCQLFSSLSYIEIEEILSKIEVKETIFQKGQILAHQGEICNRLIIPVTGIVKTEMSDPSGRVIKVEDIKAPQPLALLFLFGKNGRFPVQAIAHTEVEALIISRYSVMKLLTLSEQILSNFLTISSAYAMILTEKLYLVSFRTIRQKLASYILKSALNVDFFHLDKNQNELAEYIGVSRPALARELKKMKDEKLIFIEKRELKILNKQKLIEIVRFT